MIIHKKSQLWIMMNKTIQLKTSQLRKFNRGSGGILFDCLLKHVIQVNSFLSSSASYLRFACVILRGRMTSTRNLLHASSMTIYHIAFKICWVFPVLLCTGIQNTSMSLNRSSSFIPPARIPLSMPVTNLYGLPRGEVDGINKPLRYRFKLIWNQKWENRRCG